MNRKINFLKKVGSYYYYSTHTFVKMRTKNRDERCKYKDLANEETFLSSAKVEKST
jgi:hypothetical protein